jgi:hypothetical protein
MEKHQYVIILSAPTGNVYPLRRMARKGKRTPADAAPEGIVLREAKKRRPRLLEI